MLLVCGAQAASFTPLGDLPGGAFDSSATGVSADGSVVVGNGNPASGGGAFRWTAATGPVALNGLPGRTSAEAVSGDGATVVGWFQAVPQGRIEAFHWNTATGALGLGDLVGDSFQSESFDVSADGSVVVGTAIASGAQPGQGSRHLEAFRWTAATGMVGLGDLQGGNYWSDARGVSTDGSVVVGWSYNASSQSEAMRWTSATGMVSLGYLPKLEFPGSDATDVSDDGSVVVGTSGVDTGEEAFRWTSAGGMVGLGDLPGGGFQSKANGVSGDGGVVVGNGETSTGKHGFVWTQANGMERLQDILASKGATGIEGWEHLTIGGISSDGRWIVGSGTNPSGFSEAFLADITDLEPEVPPDKLLDLVALVDVNNSGSADLAVMVAALHADAPAAADGTQTSHLDTTDVIHVRDGVTGQKIVEFEVTNAWTSQAMDTITTGAGILLAIMQTNDTGATRVLLYNAADGTLVKTIPFFDTTWSAVDLVAVSDALGAGLEGVGVLATNGAGQHAIEVRKPGNGAIIKRANYFNNVWGAFGAIDLGDFNGNGRSELAVLARNGANKNAVEVRDSLSGVRLSRVFYLSPNFALVDFTSAADVNSSGRPEIVVLGKKNGSSNTAQAKDAKTGELIAKPIMLGPKWTTFAIRSMDDVDGNSGPEIVAAAVDAGNVTNVLIRDLMAATVTNRFGFLGPAYDPRDIEVLDDVTGNSIQDLAVVGRRDDTGQIRVQIRDASTGQKWKNIDLPVQ
jgi:probable HAF family extracellular repeat protein